MTTNGMGFPSGDENALRLTAEGMDRAVNVLTALESYLSTGGLHGRWVLSQ